LKDPAIATRRGAWLNIVISTQISGEKVSASSFETRRVARVTRTVLRMRPLC
jgi:hypothetical protein